MLLLPEGHVSILWFKCDFEFTTTTITKRLLVSSQFLATAKLEWSSF